MACRSCPSVRGRMPPRETLTDAVTGSCPPSGSAAPPGPRLPEVPGVLSAAEVLATGEHIAAMQEPSGAIGWPDGHTDAWNHVECAMALAACGLADAAGRAYDWLRRTQRADGSWPKRTVAEVVTD